MSENTVHRTQKRCMSAGEGFRTSCVHSMCSCGEDVGFSLHFLFATGHAHNDFWKPIRMTKGHTYTNIENLRPPVTAPFAFLFCYTKEQNYDDDDNKNNDKI